MVPLRLRLAVPFALLAALGAAQRGPGGPTFAEAALSGFNFWDRDGDGVLTRTEVDRATLDPSYHGEQAAALAALHTWLAAAKEAPRLTKTWFAAYRPARFTPPADAGPANAKKARKAYAATPESLQSGYAADLRRLRNGRPTDLFQGERPTLADIRQGGLGDCYLLAPLGALVYRDPDAVTRMIRPDAGGGYDVAFGDGKTVRVTPPTDAEIAMGGSSTKSGLWVRVVEKAYGSRDFAEADAAEGRIARDGLSGGSPAKAGRGFTGHRFEGIRLVGGYLKPVPDTELVPKLEETRKALVAALGERRLVVAATPKEGVPTGITPNHAYAIFGFDPKTDRITVWNPHGNDFRPKGPEGFEYGFRREGGVFSMPMRDFARTFSRIYFEDAGAAK